MTRFTGEQLKKMSSMEFTEATSKLPLEIRLKLAILAGAGDQGISVYEGNDMSDGKFINEKLNYDKLANLLNDIEEKKI
jgi:hypothetical protein